MDLNPPRKSPLDLLYEAAQRESLETFQAHMEQAMLFPKKDGLRRWSIRRALANKLDDGLYVEFGVAKGAGARLFGRILEGHGIDLTGFDSFEGLQEDWTGHHAGRGKGAFSTQGKLPDVPDNVDLIEGWVQDTLAGWLDKTAPAPLAFAHMDMDTYLPTCFALDAVKPRLQPGSVLLFDELYGYPGWKHHEWKALGEVLPKDSFTFIGFSHEAVAIEMVTAP